ncbi:unnamed protein product [Meganyctiphanes norvegica]|uniref:YIP1 family member 3 n=1 Tax=Meganyctiphanes norvegica TaxID=48144 RepID=A0AAV2PK07_MEGNR
MKYIIMSRKTHTTVTIESIDSDFIAPTSKRASSLEYCESVFTFLKPYFQVENHRLPHRFLSSLAPPIFFPEFKRVYSDLKGPLLILITLTSVLFYGAYDAERGVLNTAVTCIKLTFVYWLCFSFMAFVLGYFCDTCLNRSQLLSISGYSLTGHCLVLLIAEVLQQEENHTVFFVLLTIFGGLSTGRLAIIMLARTPGPGQRLIMCSSLATINLIHLIYIHFACMRHKFVL